MIQKFFRNGTRSLCWHWIVLVMALCLTPSALVHGADLTFSYTDPVGDFTGTIDVSAMVVVFDSVTGNYKITLTTTTAQPLLGVFRVNINLFNPNRLPSNSFFQDAGRDYNLAVAQTKLILTGTNPHLQSWSIGDTVATNTLAGLGNPPGSSFFRCSVLNIPFEFLTNEDAIAYGSGGVATINPLTPQGAVGGLIDDVQVLLETGILTTDQANGFMDKLTAAISSLNLGNTQSTCSQMKAFINQVNAFISSGKLTPAQGQALIQTADAVRTRIGCA